MDIPRNDEYYREVIAHLRWALGTVIGALAIIVTLVLAFIAFATFKNSKEYENAVASAKDAAVLAGDWESKIHERFTSIDDTVTQKLIEIEDKGQEVTAKLLEEVGRQRKLLELWAEYASLQGAIAGPPQWEYTIGLLETIREVDPNSSVVTQFLPRYHLLLAWQDESKRTEWAQKLIDICEQSNPIQADDQAWFLACAHALLDNEEECRRFVEVAVKRGGSPTLDGTLLGQILIPKYGGTAWFKELCVQDENSEGRERH